MNQLPAEILITLANRSAEARRDLDRVDHILEQLNTYPETPDRQQLENDLHLAIEKAALPMPSAARLLGVPPQNCGECSR